MKVNKDITELLNAGVITRETEDEKGFAKIIAISKEKPVDNEDYVIASIRYIIKDSLSWVSLEFPFGRFYMEESKARDAQLA